MGRQWVSPIRSGGAGSVSALVQFDESCVRRT